MSNNKYRKRRNSGNNGSSLQKLLERLQCSSTPGRSEGELDMAEYHNKDTDTLDSRKCGGSYGK